MIRFIHTADIHFGVENYGKIDPETGIHTRLLDFFRAFNAMVDYAIEHQVDFFLFCGDAYKTAHPSQTQQKLLFQCFMRLYHAHIPIIIIIGNHDHPLSFGKAHALNIFGELPLDGFHVISKPESFILRTAHGPIQIVGIPWPTRNSISLSDMYTAQTAEQLTHQISKHVTYIIQRFAEQLDPTLPAILAGHLTVSSGIFSGSEKRAIYGTDPIFIPSQLALKPFDYVALGHLHRHQNLNPSGVPVVYSGSIERIDFGERKEDKGFCDVHINNKDDSTYTFVKTPTRPFIQIDVHLTSGDNQTKKIIEHLRKHTITDAIIKILYHMPADVCDTVDINEIQSACQKAHYLVGIIPIKEVQHRNRRMDISHETMDLSSLLTAYFATKPELQKQQEQLIQKTLILAQEIADEQTH